MGSSVAYSWVERSGNQHALALLLRRAASKLLHVDIERVSATTTHIKDTEDSYEVLVFVDGKHIDDSQAGLIEKEVNRLFSLTVLEKAETVSSV